MSHPADLSRTLAALDTEGLRALGHLLSCPECSRQAQVFLNDEPATTNQALPAQELARLERLGEQIRGLAESVERLLIRLRRKQSPTHYLVRSRLECLVADHVNPALTDLASIEETARGNYEAGLFLGAGK